MSKNTQFKLFDFRPSTKTLKQIKDGEMTLLISRLYVRSNKYRNDVFGLTQSMFANQLEMIVERGFPLLRRINEILATMRDMGVMSKLFVDFNYNMTILASIKELKARQLEPEENPQADIDLNIDEDHESKDENPEIVLTVEHLEGAFSILIAGLLASSIVFVLELIFHSKFVRRSLKWLWRKMTCQSTNKISTNIKNKKLKKVS